MKNFACCLLTLMLVSGAWGQPAASFQAPPESAQVAQRRAELRTMLKNWSLPPAPAAVVTAQTQPVNRQLSEQERLELRLQLRQQRRELDSAR